MSLFCLTVCIYLHAVSACAELHLQVTIPPEGPACPGKNLVLTCHLNSMPQPKSVPPTMFWEQTVGVYGKLWEQYQNQSYTEHMHTICTHFAEHCQWTELSWELSTVTSMHYM